MKSLRLKPGRERPVQRRHPWIFSGAVDAINGEPEAGETIDIHSADGDWLARGAYSPNSQIQVRIWTWDQDEQIDDAFFHARCDAAVRMRKYLRDDPGVSAYREIHAESDMIPGLIVDRYGPFRVVQFLSQGVERNRQSILNAISLSEDLEGIFERSDAEVRALEGLGSRTGVLWGNAPPARLEIRENNLRFWVDIHAGHKTGFYLDQRANRQRAGKWMSGEVLDAFCYSGAFSVTAINAGADSVVSVDASRQALNLTEENLALNGFDGSNGERIEADVFQYLRSCRDSRRSFDTIILDPPKFAATGAQVQRAARGYKDINLLAFKLLRPGGILITFSCSGGVKHELFEKIVADAALDAGVEASIIATMSQAEDHPVRLYFPEGRYLKGLVCRLRA